MVEMRLQSRGKPAGAAAASWASWRNISSSSCRPATPLFLPARCCASRACGRPAPIVTKTNDPERGNPQSYNGGKFPLSTFLAQRVREMVVAPERWHKLPEPVQEWLKIQEWRSVIPEPGQLLVETFPRGNRHYLVCYPFEGRLAHQTLGMLLTRRLERVRLHPLGFVANEYALAVWAAKDMGGARHGRAVRRGHAGRRPG